MANQLIFLSLADIFSVYPQIFKKIVQTRESVSQVFLPSDVDWQEKMYYRLLEVQKRVNETTEVDVTDVEEKKRDLILFDPTRIIQKISPSISPNGLLNDNRKKCISIIPKVEPKIGIVWSLQNITKAAKLLRRPPLPVSFQNEQEMRRVYSLIYDVFRYKVILSNALKDISFFETFPQHLTDQSRIWLMLFELYHRNFRKRNSEELTEQTELYCEADVEDLANCLWKYHVPLAASISKMRIVCGALNLSQLLPIHLQNEKVAIAASNPVVTGWINPFALRDRTTTDAFLADMALKLQSVTETEQPLQYGEYRWDNICPLFTSCIPRDIIKFSKSELMAGKLFVMQDKTFAYGPAIMASLLDFFELEGDILQTHIASPRSTAYLASLFHTVNRVNTFYVYGAGSHLKEYRKYMESLGITNIRLFAESFTSIPMESNRFGSVVGIFANPPNSFSAVSDPIDFICSRGGDLSMLEVLTEFEISDDGKRRVTLILEEQLSTLQLAMSRPQIQFVLYQTHSVLNAENQDMVNYVVELVNRSSLEKHRRAYRERKRLEALIEAEAANIPSAALNVNSPRKRTGGSGGDEKSKAGPQKDDSTAKGDVQVVTEGCPVEDTEENITLPDCDEFVVEHIPDICLNQDSCLTLHSSGCFMSLVKRKNVTRLNAKYLIKMAEIRGLFGRGDSNKSARTRPLKTQDTSMQKASPMNFVNTETQKKSFLNIDNLIKRLNADTNASCLRSHLAKVSAHKEPLRFNWKGRECMRHKSMITKPTTRSKILWRNAFLCVKKANSSGYVAWCLSTFQQRHKLGLTYFRRRRGTNRKVFPIHINEIKLIFKKRNS